ncbi:galactosylceramide sulfotransferase-like [Saccoglossus kowalevskii]|uniref:Galactosylceramide sulfotransferase-like n=1 Tax=Saccoglossus kowalevskii TaxID=10224 RepID=A0ABM0GLI7_SACKO|nr:PREDICTED: galactosylceramide sulfotransferase-like [Saccoglossus kowalevskii]
MAKNMLPPLPGSNYSMLLSHVPFNKSAIDDVIPNARHVTIIRHPVSAYESVFGFFKISNHAKIKHNTTQNPFKTFLANTSMYFNRIHDPYHKTLLSNRQIFDLGLELEDYANETMVDHVIQRISKELDLVMILEYFDESLLLLKKLLCWEFEDIVYTQRNKRSDTLRYDIGDLERQTILKLNSADFKLYQHFNITLWLKVDAYGPNFSKDLATFRGMLNKMHSECIDDDKFDVNYGGRRNETFVKINAPEYCSRMNKTSFAYLANRQRLNQSHAAINQLSEAINQSHATTN